MGHHLTAIIASASVAKRLLREHSFLVSLPLVEMMCLIPLTNDDLDQIISLSSGTTEGFIHLTSTWRDFLAAHAATGTLVYLETDYHGGVGAQAAAVFGSSGPPQLFNGHGAINRALRSIGIGSKVAGLDEFDYVGLSRHRETEDWKEGATR